MEANLLGGSKATFNFLLLGKLHFLLGLLLLVGIVLFTVWAIKYLSKDSLKKLCLWFLAIGIIGTLLTAGYSGKHKGKYGYGKDSTKHQDATMKVFKEHGIEMEAEEITKMFEEIKEEMKSSWKNK